MSPSAPITKLPAELLQAIADNLDIEEYMVLRRSYPQVWQSLKPPALSNLLKLEFSAFAIEHKVLACHICCRLRPLCKFADDIVHRGMLKRSRPERFCIDCGIGSGFEGYGSDDWVATLDGEMHARCPLCRDVGSVGRHCKVLFRVVSSCSRLLLSRETYWRNKKPIVHPCYSPKVSYCYSNLDQ